MDVKSEKEAAQGTLPHPVLQCSIPEHCCYDFPLHYYFWSRKGLSLKNTLFNSGLIFICIKRNIEKSSKIREEFVSKAGFCSSALSLQLIAALSFISFFCCCLSEFSHRSWGERSINLTWQLSLAGEAFDNWSLQLLSGWTAEPRNRQ